MLLSFAQFEREITGERIRDKVAASKREGHLDGRSGSARLPGRKSRPPRCRRRGRVRPRPLSPLSRSRQRGAPQDSPRRREPSLAGSDEQDRPKNRRRIDVAGSPLLDPLEPDLCRTAAAQGADPRRPSSGDRRNGTVGPGPATASAPRAACSFRRPSSPASKATRRAFQDSLSTVWILILGALVVVYLISASSMKATSIRSRSSRPCPRPGSELLRCGCCFTLKTAVDRREASGFCDFARSGCIRLARAMAGPGAGGH